MAAEYNHPEPYSHITPQNQQEKTNLEEPTWEGVEPQDDPEMKWEETEQEDTLPLSPKNTEENKCVSQKKNNSRMNTSRILTQNVQGLPAEDDTKLKSIINQMKSENWDAACLQETCRLRTDDLYIDDYHIFFQGNLTKTNTRGQVMGGVCIILSPIFHQAHKKNGREVIKLEKGKNFEGRIIGVPLTFPNVVNNGKKIKEI
jgi:hypothetical protein